MGRDVPPDGLEVEDPEGFDLNLVCKLALLKRASGVQIGWRVMGVEIESPHAFGVLREANSVVVISKFGRQGQLQQI